jgi:hypothetical protein
MVANTVAPPSNMLKIQTRYGVLVPPSVPPSASGGCWCSQPSFECNVGALLYQCFNIPQEYDWIDILIEFNTGVLKVWYKDILLGKWNDGSEVVSYFNVPSKTVDIKRRMILLLNKLEHMSNEYLHNHNAMRLP